MSNHSLSLDKVISLTEEDVFRLTNSSSQGLTHSESLKRLSLYGKNELYVKKEESFIREFLLGFTNPLILILLFASAVSFAMGESFEALIIASIVGLSTVFNFVQEHQASKAAEKLKEKVSSTTLVVRDGIIKTVAIKNIVVGDIVILSSGNIIPADIAFLETKDFFVNQSSLTGESFPVEKWSVSSGEKGDDRFSHVGFYGTGVISGSAKGVVLQTGLKTQFGKISQSLITPEEETDFTKGVKSFGLFILKSTTFFVLFIFFYNSYFKHLNTLDSFIFAIAVAVGLTPELLPMIMSVTMAKGSISMSKKGVIVKKLAAIPNFGSMNILCTDKTGTLTKNKIELVKYIDVFGNTSEKVLQYAYLNSFFQTGIKNPLDEAILQFKHLTEDGFKKIDEIPFDFDRKKMSVIVESQGRRIMITKGAPEEILKNSYSYLDNKLDNRLNSSKLKEINKIYSDLSRQGFRVLAVAAKEVGKGKNIYSKNDEINFELLGFTAFYDPPKEDVGKALNELEKLGIEIKVITGDNNLVTEKICQEVGLKIKGMLIGEESEKMKDSELREIIKNTTIFCRFSPEEKNRVIKLLRESGQVVGYMGDGINDAPSLRTADVGISVSNAVDVAKESASIILTHKSLGQLKEGVLEGRKTFGNTLKYVMMGISSNFGNMFSMIGAVFFLPFLPMKPIQILLNNFMYDFSQITIPSDSVDEDWIEKPRKWELGFIKKYMFVFGILSSIFDFITFYALRYFFHASEKYFQTGWFIESLATQVLVIHIIRTKKIPFLQSKPSKPLLFSTFLIVIVGWLLPFTYLGDLLGFVALPFQYIFIITLIVFVYLFAVEITKRGFYRFNKTG